MPTETTTRPRPTRLPLNGVDTPTLFGTLDVVKGQPELAKFQFRARNRWQSGTLSETTIDTFAGAGGEHPHKTTFTVHADHPGVLVGEDRAPLPVEYLLHALASCITGGIANIAAARGVRLTEVESTIEGDINLLGILGLSSDVRNGYQGIRASFSIKGDAPPEKLQQIVEQSRARSAVFDVLTNGVPVSMSVNAG
ncbi:MAG TPA: OsmC family protein [Vicinamibacterales bacterium]|nr:OsmC family protein [Vicinamibacterales bacterium]